MSFICVYALQIGKKIHPNGSERSEIEQSPKISYRIVSYLSFVNVTVPASILRGNFSAYVRGASRIFAVLCKTGGTHVEPPHAVRSALALIAVTAVPSRQSWAMQGKHTPVNSSDIQKWTAPLDRACIFMDFVSGVCVCADRPRPVKNSCKRNHPLILVHATAATRTMPFSPYKLFRNRFRKFFFMARMCYNSMHSLTRCMQNEFSGFCNKWKHSIGCKFKFSSIFLNY